MNRFTICLERTCTIEEVATLTVTAKDARQARKLAQTMIAEGKTDDLEWEPCDTNYGRTRIDEVEVSDA